MSLLTFTVLIFLKHVKISILHTHTYKPCELYNYPIDIAQIQSNHFHQCIIPHTLLYKLKGCKLSLGISSHINLLYSCFICGIHYISMCFDIIFSCYCLSCQKMLRCVWRKFLLFVVFAKRLVHAFNFYFNTLSNFFLWCFDTQLGCMFCNCDNVSLNLVLCPFKKFLCIT